MGDQKLVAHEKTPMTTRSDKGRERCLSPGKDPSPILKFKNRFHAESRPISSPAKIEDHVTIAPNTISNYCSAMPSRTITASVQAKPLSIRPMLRPKLYATLSAACSVIMILKNDNSQTKPLDKLSSKLCKLVVKTANNWFLFGGPCTTWRTRTRRTCTTCTRMPCTRTPYYTRTRRPCMTVFVQHGA